MISATMNNSSVIQNYSDISAANISANSTTKNGNWSFGPSLTLLTILVGAFFNISLLIIFCQRATMRTAFGMYLINLIIANTMMACLWEPITLIQLYYSSWTFGYGACVFRQFLAWIIEAAINWSHFLIAINRFWAVVFPVSYRHHHKVKLATGTCLVTWLVIIVSIVPTIVVTRTKKCHRNVHCDARFKAVFQLLRSNGHSIRCEAL